MGTLHLHPRHPFFLQFKHPACPTCQTAIVPKHAIVFEYLDDGRYLVKHQSCAEHGANKFG